MILFRSKLSFIKTIMPSDDFSLNQPKVGSIRKSPIFCLLSFILIFALIFTSFAPLFLTDENIVYASENELTRVIDSQIEWNDAWGMDGIESDGDNIELETADLVIDPSVWTVGTGSAPDFNQNGTTAENYRILANNPFGEESVIWEARPDSVSDADGGWNTSSFSVDTTKMYRFSVWVQRPVKGNGHFYFGTRGYGSVNGLLIRSSGANTTNYYFTVNSNWTEWGDTSSWYLAVGHIWPVGSGTGSNKAESGIYNTSGSIIYTADLTDFVWRPETTTSNHRSYLYYSTDTSTRQRWAYPRVDIIDGNEPSIQELLNSWPDLKEETGYRISQPLSLNEATKVKESSIEWSATTSEYTNVDIYTAITDEDKKYALEFEDDGDYINAGTGASLTFGGGDFSWESWVYVNEWNSLSVQNSLMTRGGTADATDGWRTAIYNDGSIWTTISDGIYRTVIQTDDSVIMPGQWHHIAVTYDRDGYGTIYVDGEVEASVLINSSSGNITTNRSLIIGNYALDDYRPLDGIMDEIRIWDTARTQQQIQDNMYQQPDSVADLAAYWKLNEGEGVVAADNSENNNQGSVQGASWTINSGLWQEATSGNPIPGINENDDLSNKYLWVRQALSQTKRPDIHQTFEDDVKNYWDSSNSISTTRAKYGNKSILIPSTASAAYSIGSSAIEGNQATFDYWIYLPSGLSRRSYLTNGVWRYSSGSLQSYNGSSYVTFASYNQDNWNHIKITNGLPGEKFYHVWVNGVYYRPEARYDTGSPMNVLSFSAEGSNIWIDEFKHYENISSITPTISSITETITYGGIITETQEAISINPYSATLQGAIIELNGENSALERGFEWGEIEGGPYDDSWTEEGIFAVGSFSHQISDLNDDNTYYYRAKARDAEEWAYGEEMSFQTLDDSLQVSTTGSQIITGQRVDLTGSIDQISTLRNVTERGFEWGGMASGPYLYSWTEEGDFTADEFYYSIDGLIHNTIYYFRAKAQDSEGWTYGQEMMFTTYYDPAPGSEEEVSLMIEEHDDGWLGTEDNVDVTSGGLILSSGISGTRTSTAYDLSSIGTSGGSEISWSGDIPSFGGALEFSDGDYYVNAGNDESIQVLGNQTIEMWLKPDNFTVRRNPWNKAYGGEGTITQEINGTLNYYWGTNGGDGSPYQGFNSNQALNLGEWNHVVIVRNITGDGLLRWYINGVETNRTTVSYNSAVASSASLLIGKGYTNAYDGLIDEVRLWSIARTSQQIEDNMYREVSGNESGLVGYWKFNEVGGSVAYDSSNNSNDGSITGATWSSGIQTSVGVETNVSLDGGNSWQGWQSASDGGSVLGLERGTDISNGRVQIRQTLTTNHASVTPLLEESILKIFLYYELYDEHGANVGGWAWSENIGWVSFNNDDVADYLASYDSSSGEIEGWAWSENIGWISWNCATDSTCNPATEDYKVSVSGGNLSGWAWSDNLGWLSFDRDITGNPPGEPYQSDGAIARYDSNTRRFSGWARFTAAPEGDWDGWVKLRCYGDECDDWVNENSATGGLFVREDNRLDGWIWGSDVVGWIGVIGIGAYNYGLNINTESFKLGGHIWSDNLGWITFNRDGPLGAGVPPENDPCAQENDCIAIFDPDESAFYGWARAINHDDSWDGWISLRGTALDDSPYGVSLNTTTKRFEGWAYGGEILGWISFNSLNEVSNPPEYYVYTTMDFGLDASGLGVEWNYCIDTLHPTLSWETDDTTYGYSVEIYNDAGLTSIVYQYEANDSSASSHHPDYDAGVCHVGLNGYQNTGICDLEYGDTEYWWQVKVKDVEGQWGGWSTTGHFTVENDHHWPESGFSFSPDPARIEIETNFIDESTSYGGSILGNWLWTLSGSEGIDYNYVNETSDTSQNPDIIFQTKDDYSISLDVWDSSGYGPCRMTQPVSVDEASDIEWREVSPAN